MGSSAEEVSRATKEGRAFPGCGYVSSKTVRRIYAKIGEALYRRILEPTIHEFDPWTVRLKEKFPDDYERVMQTYLTLIHMRLLESQTTNTEMKDFAKGMIASSGWAYIYKQLSNQKYGFRGESIKGNLAAAWYRSGFRCVYGHTHNLGFRMSVELERVLLGSILDMFRKNPC